MPALYYDSDSLVRRFGRSWPRRLEALGADQFIELARVLDPRYVPRRVPVSSRELERTRKAINLSIKDAEDGRSHEPEGPIDFIVAQVSKRHPPALLDIGSGGGFLLAALNRNRAAYN